MRCCRPVGKALWSISMTTESTEGVLDTPLNPRSCCSQPYSPSNHKGIEPFHGGVDNGVKAGTGPLCQSAISCGGGGFVVMSCMSMGAQCAAVVWQRRPRPGRNNTNNNEDTDISERHNLLLVQLQTWIKILFVRQWAPATTGHRC